MKTSGTQNAKRKKSLVGWNLLLIIPYVALCFPQFYVRLSPSIWGFPFFYWYQFAWVLLTSAILGIYYRAVASRHKS